MKSVSKIIDWFGRPVTLTWIEINDPSELSKYSPVTQVYAVCFNDLGEILVLDQKGKGEWTLPGGTVEEGETLRETLEREISEEADVYVCEISLLGVQKVEDPQSGDPKKHLHYQARYFARIDKVLPQTVDPAKNRIHERRFVPASEIGKFIKWGNTGDAIFSDAIKLFRSRDEN